MPTYTLSAFVVGDIGCAEGLTRIAAAGFREVELSGTRGRLDDWPSDPDQMRRDLRAHGLRVRSVHSPAPGWDIAARDGARRRAAIEATTACFGQSAQVGADIVVCHPNGPADPFTPQTFHESWARTLDSLAILAESARRAGVKIALENLPAYGRPRPGSTIGHVLAMIDGLGENVGICLDAGHSNSNGLSAAAEAVEAAEKLLVLHLQDNDGRGEDQHLIPGLGTIDWDAFLTALDGINFQGVRTIEIAYRPDLDGTMKALAALRKEWEAR
jgi:sugar phosphate isomerase/epimerase